MNQLLDLKFDSPAPSAGIVKRLSQRHRNLARMLASGVSPGQCARVLRYDPSRVSVLQNDPAFKALVEFYSTVQDEEFKRNAEKLADLNEVVIDELTERLEENPDEFSPSQLTELLKVTSDRTGLGPTSTVRHAVAVVTPDDIAKIKERIAQSNAGTVNLVSEFSGAALGSPALHAPEGSDSPLQIESHSARGDDVPEESSGEDLPALPTDGGVPL